MKTTEKVQFESLGGETPYFMAIFDYTMEKPIDERYLLCLYIYIVTTRSNVPRLNIHGKAFAKKVKLKPRKEIHFKFRLYK